MVNRKLNLISDDQSRFEFQLIELINDIEAFKKMECFPSGFNIFEAVGMVAQEIKHSNFLSFLFDPSKEHPYRDSFVRSFLQEAAKNSNFAEFSPLTITLNDYSDIKVHREWGNSEVSQRKIDIVLVSVRNKQVFVIENKVFASESQGQLNDYEKSINEFSGFLGFEKYFIFLTPNQDDPSESAWSTVC